LLRICHPGAGRDRRPWFKRTASIANDPGLRRGDNKPTTFVSRQAMSGEADLDRAAGRSRRGAKRVAAKPRRAS
jgi:hypothetical protein